MFIAADENQLSRPFLGSAFRTSTSTRFTPHLSATPITDIVHLKNNPGENRTHFHCLCGAVMATFTPRPPTSRPLTSEFAPSSPPDRSYYNMHNGAPQTANSNQPANGNRVQHRLSTDFKSNGHAPVAANGNAGMPVPNGLQHHASSGGSRHRGTVSMGTFDGPRSPPNTKSMPHIY